MLRRILCCIVQMSDQDKMVWADVIQRREFQEALRCGGGTSNQLCVSVSQSVSNAPSWSKLHCADVVCQSSMVWVRV